MEKSDILIYNNNNIFSSRMVNILNKYFKKKVLIFCHGEMEVLNQELCLGRLSEIIKKNVLKLFLDKRQKIAENLFFIVLGEHIQTNLRKIIPKHIFDHILSMEHPYIFSHKNGAKPRGKTISFGTVGTVIKNKNIEQFLILVNSFQNEVEKGDISFTIVGPVHYKKEEILSAKINILTESGLSRERFNKELDKLDYVLYFYNSNMYRFTASGVIFDSINMEKPILALKTRYFEYLFSVYGSFGLLLDSTKDMIDSIYRLINGSLLNDIFFDDIKQKLSIENIAGQFKETLKKIEYYRDIWW
jgi:hypothetical protein